MNSAKFDCKYAINFNLDLPEVTINTLCGTYYCVSDITDHLFNPIFNKLNCLKKLKTKKMNEEEIQMVVLEAIDKIKHTSGIKGAARFASMNYSVYEVAMEVGKMMNEKLTSK